MLEFGLTSNKSLKRNHSTAFSIDSILSETDDKKCEDETAKKLKASDLLIQFPQAREFHHRNHQYLQPSPPSPLQLYSDMMFPPTPLAALFHSPLSEADYHLKMNPFAYPLVPGSDLGSYLMHSYRKPKRVRTAFSPHQLLQLEKAFEVNQYVVGQERKELATTLQLTETQVKVWFQNRRTKHKRVKSDSPQLVPENVEKDQDFCENTSMFETSSTTTLASDM